MGFAHIIGVYNCDSRLSRLVDVRTNSRLINLVVLVVCLKFFLFFVVFYQDVLFLFAQFMLFKQACAFP